MNVVVSRSHISGRVVAPPSKSYTIRGLMCAALAPGESRLLHPLRAEDTEAAARVLGQIGVAVHQEEGLWRVTGDRFQAPRGELFCGDSAATLRFMTTLCSLVPGECRLTAGASLSRRPVRPLVGALQKWGVDCSAEGDRPPVVVKGGRLKGGETEIPGDISSQFVSALLLVAPRAEGKTRIRVTTPLESRSYVRMTLECLGQFGIRIEASPDLRELSAVPQTYRPAEYAVEGDWSSASYFLALGAVAGEVAVENLNPASLQGDRILLDFLRRMGAGVTIDQDAIRVKKAGLKAIEADLTECIDLLPTVAVLAALAEGKSVLTGIRRARLKESDRVAAVREGLAALGSTVEEGPDRLTIVGGETSPANIDPHNDHRMAMAFAVLGLARGNVVVKDAGCVAKTFPDFWRVVRSIGGEVKIDEQ